jgi:hypothetical protein
MKKTALIILNYNNYLDTIECVKSVLKYNTSPVKFVIIDNGSTKREAPVEIDKYLREEFRNDYVRVGDSETAPQILPSATFIVSSSNDGYASGNNKGLTPVYRDSEIDRVMILNNDILFVEDIVPRLIERMDTLSDCAIISPILYKRDGESYDYNCARENTTVKTLIKRNLFHYVYRAFGRNGYAAGSSRHILMRPNVDMTRPIEIELPSGSCMLVKKDLFESIGSFDPNTFLYYEENILFKKVQRLGLKNYLDPTSHCIHLGACSTSKSPGLNMILFDLDSMKYYVNTYESPGFLSGAMFNFSVTFARSAARLQKSLKG